MTDEPIDKQVARLQRRHSVLRARVDSAIERVDRMIENAATHDDLDALKSGFETRLSEINDKVGDVSLQLRLDRRRAKKRDRRMLGEMGRMIRTAFRNHDTDQSKTRQRLMLWALLLLGSLLATNAESPINPFLLLKAAQGVP